MGKIDESQVKDDDREVVEIDKPETATVVEPVPAGVQLNAHEVHEERKVAVNKCEVCRGEGLVKNNRNSDELCANCGGTGVIQ